MSHLLSSSIDEHTGRLAVLLIRQSSTVQRLENTGSSRYQKSMADFLRQLGWPADRIEVLDALGESGSRGDRPQFRSLLRSVQKGEVGAVAFARGDRLGRTAVESEELLKAAAQTRTLIITEGRIYNPSSAGDKLMLGLMAQFAEYENMARTLWMVATRFALAKEASHRIILPTGLIWGSPDDPIFVAHLDEAGLGHHLRDLDGHQACSTRKGRRYYILPYPDREVYESCRLRMEWIQTHRCLSKVVALIQEDPRYPRPGLIPSTKAITRYHPDIEIRWQDVAAEYGRPALRKWFTSQALYGTYSFRSRALAKQDRKASQEKFRVLIPNAFPGFAQHEERERVLRIVERDVKPWRQGKYKGPRIHLLDMVRCGRRDGDGQPCGRKLHAMYDETGKYSYYSQECRRDGEHNTQYVSGRGLDALIPELVLRVLRPDRLAKAMASLDFDAGSAKDRLDRIDEQIRRMEHRIASTRNAAIQAVVDEAPDRAALFNEELDRMLAEKAHLTRQSDGARADLDDFQGLAEADRRRVLGMAEDLGVLIERGRNAAPAVARGLLSEMVRRVYVDRLNAWVLHVEVVLPGGHRIETSYLSGRIRASRVGLEYAAGELGRGRRAEAIAARLNEAGSKNHYLLWDEERIQVAPYALIHQPLDALRPGPHQRVSEIASTYGIPENDVFLPAVRGELGPGRYEDGEIHINPTLEELHRRVPEIARADMAQKMGWPVGEVLTRADASERSGLSRSVVVRRARQGAGLAKDAAGQHWVRSIDM